VQYNPSYAADVAGLGGADPVVVAAVERLPEPLEAGGHPLDPRLGGDAAGRGRLHDGLAVLVHAHQKMDLVPPHPAVARDGVGPDLFEGVAQVWVAVAVVNRRCQVVLGQGLTVQEQRGGTGRRESGPRAG
jgi:hypothetical protein